MDNFSKAFLGFGSYSCPLSLFFRAPKCIIFGSPIAPKEEKDGRGVAPKTSEFVNHETHVLARNRKAKHPTREVNNIIIFGDATKACLEDEPNRIFTEANRGAAKTSNKRKS